MMGPGFGYGYMDGYMGWMAFGSILFWIAIVALCVFAIVRFSPRRERNDDALSTLERRLASGEIGADEYRERRALLVGH